MRLNYYWFNPETSTLYGPNATSHTELMNTDRELSKIIDKIFDELIANDTLDESHSLHDVLVDMDWVRMCYNTDSNELSIACLKNKNSLKSIRSFIKKQGVDVKSLFLDINDIHFQGSIPEIDLNSYIKYGRMK